MPQASHSVLSCPCANGDTGIAHTAQVSKGRYVLGDKCSSCAMKPRNFKAGEDAALVLRAQGGDELAFRQLVERYQSKVLCIIRGILGRHNEVDDIAQQVFVKIYFSLNSFDFRSSLFTWIYKITVNECFAYLRKKRLRKLVYENEFLPEDAHGTGVFDPVTEPSTPVDREVAQREFVTKLLAALSAEERSLIMLKEVEGRSVEELAAMCGVNENTIKVRLFRIRQKLLTIAQRLSLKQP